MSSISTLVLLPSLLVSGAVAQSRLSNGLPFPSDALSPLSPSQVPRSPSYLSDRPSVLPINNGRQLFVDDFLIQSTTLQRVFHRPVKYSGNPILRQGGDDVRSAAPFSDGVWFDPSDRLYKMFYWGGAGNAICLATSIDGKTWLKPVLKDAAVPNSNIVLLSGGGRDSSTVWMDLEERDASRKFKAFIYIGGNRLGVYFSADGRHWLQQPVFIPSVSDRTTLFWNPFRGKWIESTRSSGLLPAGRSRPAYSSRLRYYSESEDLLSWAPPQDTRFWIGPDESDPPYPGGYGIHFPQLYNLDAVAYESLLVGLFSWYYPAPGPELVELGIGFSRDGFQWSRPVRGGGPNAFIGASNRPGEWDAYNTQSAGGGFLVVGDELWFYYSGRDAIHGSTQQSMSTGLAILRRDGFASMDAGTDEGQLTTQPLRFDGDRLYVNIANPSGDFRVVVLDADFKQIDGFTKRACHRISADGTAQSITWEAADLSSLKGSVVRFRFYLTRGALYSFWISPSSTGSSRGFVAAGGPGFSGPVDTGGLQGDAVGIPTPPRVKESIQTTGPSHQDGIQVLTDRAAVCSYSTFAEAPFADMRRMASTGSVLHSEALPSLKVGKHIFYVRCTDYDGNTSLESLAIVIEIGGVKPYPAGNPEYAIQVDSSSVKAGSTISLRWSAPERRSRYDWLGLYSVSATNREFQWYSFVANGTSGSVLVKLPLVPGEYEFRFLTDNTYNDVAKSEPFLATQ